MGGPFCYDDFPVTAQSVTPPQNSPCLEYKMFLFHPGNLEVEAIVAPTLNFVPGRGLRLRRFV